MTDLIEIDYCDFCHQKTSVNKKYYAYPFNCDCCGGQYHYAMVKYCNKCEPHPPKYITVKIKPIGGASEGY